MPPTPTRTRALRGGALGPAALAAAALVSAAACGDGAAGAVATPLIDTTYAVLARRGVCPSVAACQRSEDAHWGGEWPSGVHVRVRGIRDPRILDEIEASARRAVPTLPDMGTVRLEFYDE